MEREILLATLTAVVLIVGPVWAIIAVARDLRRARREEATRLGKRRFRKRVRS